MIIVDTSVLVDILANKEPTVGSFSKLKENEFSISIVTVAEMECGFHFLSSKTQVATKERLDKLIEDGVLNLLGMDRKIALYYGKIQANLKSVGQIMSQFDAVIAASAIAYNYTLVTSDDDFQRIEGLKLLKI